MFDIVATTDWAQNWNGGYVAASLGGSFVVFAIGLVIGRLRGLGLSDMAVDGLNASYANSAYIGLPLLTLAVGPETRSLVVISATLTLMALFSAAIMLIELGRNHGHGIDRALVHAVAAILRTPILIAPLLGLLWWYTGLPLPRPIESFVHLLGVAASPTALVAIGLFLAQRPLRAAATDRFVWMLSMTKLIVQPAVTAILAWYVFALPPLVALTVIAVAAMPTGTGPFMIAELYARDGKVTTGPILVSTVLSIVSIAAILTVLGR
jgi:predicted permease